MNMTGHLIRRFRLEAGLDLEDLAFRSGISVYSLLNTHF